MLIDNMRIISVLLLTLVLLAACAGSGDKEKREELLDKQRLEGEMHALLDSCNEEDKNYEIARDKEIADSVGSASLFYFKSQMANIENTWYYGKLRYATQGLKMAVDCHNDNYVDAFYEELASVECKYLGYSIPEVDNFIKELKWIREAEDKKNHAALGDALGLFVCVCDLMDVRGFGNQVVEEKLNDASEYLTNRQFAVLLAKVAGSYYDIDKPVVGDRMLDLALRCLKDEQLSESDKAVVDEVEKSRLTAVDKKAASESLTRLSTD